MSDGRGSTFDAVLALLIRVAGAGLVFGLQVLLARVMTVDGYGGFVTLWTWMLALGSFAALGFAESSVRFLPRYHLRGRLTHIRSFWRFGLIVVLGASGLLALLSSMLVLGFGPVDGVGLTVLIVAMGLPSLAIEYYLEGVARSFGWFRLAAVPVYIIRPIVIGATCVALASSGVALTLPVIGGVLVGTMALVTAGLGLLVARRIRRMTEGDLSPASRSQRRLWLMASLPLLLLSGLEDLTSYADVLLLSLIAGPEAVGVYFAAARTLALAGFVAYAMTLVAGRRFALDLAGRSRAQLQNSVLQSTRLTFWATLLSVGATLLVGPFLLAAFGPDYVEGQGVMIVLGLGMVVRAMAGQAGELLIVAGRQREGLAIGLCVLAMTVVLCLLLVPSLGMLGAAIATASAMACRTAALIVVLGRVEGLRIIAFGLPRPRPV